MNRKTAPVAITAQPNISPVPAAKRVALRKLRVRFQAIEAQHPPAIKGEAGEDVEHGQEDVREREVAEHRLQLLARSTYEDRGAKDGEGEREAGSGSGRRDEEFLARGARLAREVGDAPEDEERDARYRQSPPDGHHRMGELVEENGDEQEDGGRRSHQPVGGGAPALVGVGEEARRQQVGHDPQDEQPGGVHLNGDPSDGGNAKAAREHASTVGHGERRRHDKAPFALAEPACGPVA